MKSPSVPLAVLATFCGFTSGAPALAEEVELDTVTVYGKTESSSPPIAVDDSTPATSYRLDRQAIERLGAPGKSNPYRVLDDLPSVSVANIDPYGLANIEGGNKGLRVRGEIASHGANGSIEGLPLTGINPGPGYQWLFDMENIASVSLTQGAIPPDRLAFFTISGALDSRLRWPEDKFHVHLSQSFGSYDFTRTFGRVDTGEFGDGWRVFVSGSYTSADQWRGSGQSPNGRQNFEGAISRTFGNGAEAKIYVSYNDMSGDSYRPLDYTQSRNLSRYRDYGYSSSPLAGADYYGNNTQDFIDWTVIGEFILPINDTTTVTFKPFYVKEEGNYLSGMSNGMVREWLIDHDWYGFTAEVETRIRETNLKLGYWVNSMDPPGPPTAWKMYAVNAAGNRQFRRWSLLADATDRHIFQSVYTKLDHQFGPLKVEGGVRYLWEKLPGFDTYNTTGVGNVSHDTAIAQSSGVIAARSAGSATFSKWLPYLGLTYEVNPDTDVKLTMGRNYGAPAYSIWPVFQSRYSSFQAAGVTAGSIWDSIKPEISDDIDLGLTLRFPNGSLQPTLYYSRFDNKSVAFWDPVVGLAYAQNVGEGHTYGAQIIGNWQARRTLEFFGSLSYSRAVFDKNLKTSGGATLDVKGNQIPGTPEWLASFGARWHHGPYSISPVVHCSGDYYADSTRTEKVSGYATVDLDLAYKNHSVIGDYTASLSFINLFDKDYIGYVNTGYVEDTGGFNYYPGTPFTVVAQVSLDF